MSCPTLLAYYHLPVSELIEMGNQLLTPSQMLIAQDYPHTISPCSMHQNLANTLYYEYGRHLASSRQWNDMTRLQMVHELRERDLLSDDEEKELSDFQLRMKMVRATLVEQDEAGRMERMRKRLREEDRERREKGVRERESHERKEKGVASTKRKREEVEV